MEKSKIFTLQPSVISTDLIKSWKFYSIKFLRTAFMPLLLVLVPVLVRAII